MSVRLHKVYLEDNINTLNGNLLAKLFVFFSFKSMDNRWVTADIASVCSPGTEYGGKSDQLRISAFLNKHTHFTSFLE